MSRPGHGSVKSLSDFKYLTKTVNGRMIFLSYFMDYTIELHEGLWCLKLAFCKLDGFDNPTRRKIRG